MTIKITNYDELISQKQLASHAGKMLKALSHQELRRQSRKKVKGWGGEINFIQGEFAH